MADRWKCGSCSTEWIERGVSGWGRWVAIRPELRKFEPALHDDPANRCECGAPRPARPEIADVPDEVSATARDALQSSSHVVAGEFRDAGYFETPREPQVRIVVTASKSMAPYLVYELCQRDNVTVKVEE